MIHSLNDRIMLNNQIEIPGIGLGVFQIPDTQTAEVVKAGIVKGYRLIDTAQIYDNEIGTGIGIKEGLKAAGISREELFVTSKVWNDHLTYDETIQAFETSLARLGLDYLDLYLIHWPGEDAFLESWRALEQLYQAGKIKAIGVSNFQITHLEKLLTHANVIPVLNQVELHPKLSQIELRNFCAKHAIKIQAWSPLMQGKLLNHPTIVEIAEAHHITPAQVILRWDVQQDILLMVKSVKPERMKSNADIFDFVLSEDEMTVLNALNDHFRVGPNPDTFDFK